MADISSNINISGSVTVERIGGKWVVTIVEQDGRSERDFEIESFARSYADGQRHRLGLVQPDQNCPSPGSNGTGSGSPAQLASG